jgi:ribose 5-phosphate isomerase A
MEQMKPIDKLKQDAAHAAVERVGSGMIVGLGSGSTVRFALERMAQRIREYDLANVSGVPSSLVTEQAARQLGIPLTTLDRHPELDLTIDGADEVDPDLNLIKGGGGALLREKVIAQAGRCNVVIVDHTKLSPRLGTRFALPVEVLTFAVETERRFLSALGATVRLRRTAEDQPFLTDQNNFILDAAFGPIADVRSLAARLAERAGIMEHGLFVDTTAEVIVAGQDGIRCMKRSAE